MKTKITLIFILIVFSHNLLGQNSLYNIFAKSSFTKTSETTFGEHSTYENSIVISNFNKLLKYSGCTLFIGINPVFVNLSDYSKVGVLFSNQLKINPSLRIQRKNIFVSIGYKYSILSIKTKDYPGSWTFLLPPSKIFEQGVFIDAGIQLKLKENQYLEFSLGYEKLKYKQIIEQIPDPIIDYTQQDYFFKIQTLSSNIKFSKIRLLNSNEIQQKPWMFFLNSQLYKRKDTIYNNISFETKSRLYFGKFVTNKATFTTEMSYGYKKYDKTFSERFLLIEPELKYLFYKSFFTGVSYEFGFFKTNEKYLVQSFSASVGNYLKLTNNSILETKMFYSYETLLVGKYQPEYGNQINNRIGFILRSLVLF